MPFRKKASKNLASVPSQDAEVYMEVDEIAVLPTHKGREKQKKKEKKEKQKKDHQYKPDKNAARKENTPRDAALESYEQPESHTEEVEYEGVDYEEMANTGIEQVQQATGNTSVTGQDIGRLRNSGVSDNMDVPPEVPRKGSLLLRRSVSSDMSSGSHERQQERDSNAFSADERISQDDHLTYNDGVQPAEEDRVISTRPRSNEMFSNVQPLQQSQLNNPPKLESTRLQSLNVYKGKNLPVACIEGDATLPSMFDHPWGICLTKCGTIFMTDVERCQVIKLDKSGQLLAVFGTRGKMDGQFDGPQGIALKEDDSILGVCDTKNRRVQLINVDGFFIRSFGNEGPPESQMRRPVAIAMSTSGTIYVSDQAQNLVHVWSMNGEPMLKIGSEGSGLGQFRQPQGVAVFSDGNLLVADTNNDRIQLFTEGGQPMTAIGQSGEAHGELDAPKAITVDADDNIIVADVHNNRVQILSNEGNFILVVGCSARGSEEGEFDQPTGIAVDDNNKIYVCDYYNRRIQIF